jgi:S1-C subfamily serine protease
MRLAPAVRLAGVLVLLTACARLPASDAKGTPAEAVAARSFALLSVAGLPVGSAVSTAQGRLLTSGHVIPAGVNRLAFQRGDGAAAGEARLFSRSPRMDLALLAIPHGLIEPVSLASSPLRVGQDLWAVGAPSVGHAVASGRILHSSTTLEGYGPGFLARLPALLGYSGGPAVDEQGRLLGLVTALPQPGAAPLLAALSGLDLHGLALGRGGRDIFLLSASEALAEVQRLAPP